MTTDALPVRTEIIRFRATPAERELIARLADEERGGPSRLFRRLVREEATRRGITPPTPAPRKEP